MPGEMAKKPHTKRPALGDWREQMRRLHSKNIPHIITSAAAEQAPRLGAVCAGAAGKTAAALCRVDNVGWIVPPRFFGGTGTSAPLPGGMPVDAVVIIWGMCRRACPAFRLLPAAFLPSPRHTGHGLFFCPLTPPALEPLGALQPSPNYLQAASKRPPSGLQTTSKRPPNDLQAASKRP